jgi:mRNA-degrading endonuclease RelE of RelBE toxin-antitoxin system
MALEIVFRPSARRELALLPAGDRDRILTRLEAYALDPNRTGHPFIRLTGSADVYRLRSGVWRVLFTLEDGILCVRRVSRRREAYR